MHTHSTLLLPQFDSSISLLVSTTSRAATFTATQKATRTRSCHDTMAPLKRKRPLDVEGLSRPPPVAATPTQQVAVSRPATRSIAPLAVPQELPPRRRRTTANGHAPMATSARQPEAHRGKENIPMAEHHLPKPTRLTRQSGPSDAPAHSLPLPAVAPAVAAAAVGGLDAHRPGSIFTPIPIPVVPRAPTRSTALTGARAIGGGQQHSRPGGAPLVLPPQQHTVGRSKSITISASIAQARQSPPDASAVAAGQNKRKPKNGRQQSDRNIDKVVLGNICFRAWYPSYYGKEVLGDGSGIGHNAKGGKGGKVLGGQGNGIGGGKDAACGAKTHGRRDRDNPPILDRLYVCPCCFKYSKELVAWWGHVRVCERRGFVPGNKIYVHPKGSRTVLVPSGPASKPARGRRAMGGQRTVEEVVQDEGEWSIWEVDGENDVVSSPAPLRLTVCYHNSANSNSSSFVRTSPCSPSCSLIISPSSST